MGYSQVVRHQILTLSMVGSNPTTLATYKRLSKFIRIVFFIFKKIYLKKIEDNFNIKKVENENLILFI